MKAKSSFSGMASGAVAKGTIGIFSAVAAFVAGFIVWSAAGLGGALITLIAH